MRVGTLDKLLSLDARGRFGYGGGFGRIALGYNRFGFYSKFSGIYSKKYYYGVPYISKMKMYRPTNNRLENQQAWRAVFRDGFNVWKTFDENEKNKWRKRAKNLHMTGFNKFMSEYLQTHRL
jgi:hypothetical protein